MLKKTIHLAKNPLISGSAIIFISSNASNFIHFLFNLFMSRNLSVPDFGTLAALSSLIALTGIFSSALMPTIIKFAAEHFANNEHEKVKALFIKVTQLSLVFGGVILHIFFVFQEAISHFFNISKSQDLIIISGFVAMASLLFAANNSFMQAKLAFTYLSFVNFLSALIKLGLGIGLVLLGFRVNGALFAFFLSLVIPYVISFLPLRFVFAKSKNKVQLNIKELVTYGIPAAVCTFSLTSLMSADLILVKHFFDPNQAGLYAGLSLVGKVIFFFSISIGSTMFPLVVQKYTKRENYHGIFGLSIMLLLLSCIGFTFLYFFYPHFVIAFFLKRQEYYAISGFLGIMGLLISAFAVLSLFVNFFLSIKKTNIFVPLLIGALGQIVLLWIFHETFTQIIVISLGIMSLLLFTLLLYYFQIKRSNG